MKDTIIDRLLMCESFTEDEKVFLVKNMNTITKVYLFGYLDNE